MQVRVTPAKRNPRRPTDRGSRRPSLRYRDSVVRPDELGKFPVDGALEMLEQEERVDLGGEVRVCRPGRWSGDLGRYSGELWRYSSIAEM